MREAAQALQRAETSPQEWRRAFDAAVRGHYRAAAALRAAARQLAAHLAPLSAERADLTDRLGAAVTALQMLEQARASSLAQPGGAVSAARAGHLLAALTLDLDAQLLALQLQIAQIAQLRGQAETALQGLARTGRLLDAARAQHTAARAPDLSAVTDGLVARLTVDAEALDRLAAGVAGLPVAPPPTAQDAALPPPLRGRLAGPAERLRLSPVRTGPGMVLLARPGTPVYAPALSTLLHAGELRGQGGIAILELGEDLTLVMVGLGRIDRRAGEVLHPGTPLGLLGGLQAADELLLMRETETAREMPEQPLYIEIRRNGDPLETAPWFALDR
ncbi:MAG: hypothetical protein AAFR46_00575 [Pseudomonadota bacterium]